MNGHWVEIPPETYVINLSSDPSVEICGLGILVSAYDYWLLGDVFLRNYYVVHDMVRLKPFKLIYIYSL